MQNHIIAALLVHYHVHYIRTTIYQDNENCHQYHIMQTHIKMPLRLCSSVLLHIQYLMMLQLFVIPLLLEASSSASLVASHSTLIDFLPGFHGPLPFQLETGYVGVGDDESKKDVQLFYYFVKSERSPRNDPVLLWLTGGPGCSSLTGLVYEIGPLKFKVEQYNGSLPTLILNPHSWTKVSNIIFLDSPVGTGFSYGKTPLASLSSDLTQTEHAQQFLRKWLVDHPEFISNPFYVGGDSYSGITIPILTLQISKGDDEIKKLLNYEVFGWLGFCGHAGNEEGIKPLINLQGYLIGNPITDRSTTNIQVPFAHGMGLISDELYKSLQENCGGEYENVDPSNTACLKDVEAYKNCIKGINSNQILESKCVFASPKPQEMVKGERRSSRSLHVEDSQVFQLVSDSELPRLGCREYGYSLSRFWANDHNVRKALGVQAESIGQWKRCNFAVLYDRDVPSSVEFHALLGTKGYRSLIYSGDHDMGVPFTSTQAWIRSLNFSIVDDWRPWFVNGQVGGYTRTYSNRMTFATVKGGGHTAPETRPEECFAMFGRWLHSEPL